MYFIKTITETDIQKRYAYQCGKAYGFLFCINAFGFIFRNLYVYFYEQFSFSRFLRPVGQIHSSAFLRFINIITCGYSSEHIQRLGKNNLALSAIG